MSPRIKETKGLGLRTKVAKRIKGNAKQLIIALGLFLLALGPRAFGLGVFITPDERRWIERSVQFFSALSVGDLADTFQTGHPGVTTKWTGTIGLLVKYLCQAGQPSLAGLRAFLEAVPVNPSVSVEYLPVTRFPTALLTAACVAAIYFMVRRLFGDRVALLSGVLLALDPFYLSHSRVIHHDALATTFMTLAVLSFLVCAWHQHWRTFLVFSGLAAGLAFLSKGPALFLAPFVGFLCVMGYLAQLGTCPERGRREPRRRHWHKIGSWTLVRWLSAWLGWVAVALLIFFLLWPVTWVEPLGAIWGLLTKAIGYAGEAHTKGNFFLGRVVDDPGPLFYPLTLLFRTTPLTLLGLAAAFCFWIRECWSVLRHSEERSRREESRSWQANDLLCEKRDPSLSLRVTNLGANFPMRFIDWLLGKGEERETRSRKLSLLSLWAYLFSFVLFMTLGAKKFDRYILPIYPTVEILAALGLCQLLEPLRRFGSSFQAESVFAHRESSCCQGYSQPFGRLRTPPSQEWLWVLGLAAALILQAGFTLPHYPYYLTYYNPLVGGSWLAPKTYYVGWGEGLDQMARYLNKKPGAAQLEVSSWYHREFIPFFLGSADRLDAKGDANLMPWHMADYVVFYLNQVQRDNPSQALVSYIRSLEPEHVVRMKGIDYAWLYRTPEHIPDDVVPAQHVQRAWFGEDLSLLGYDVDGSQVPLDRLGTPPLDGKVRVNLYWEGRREMEADYRIFLDLVNGVYHVWGKQDGRPYWDSYPTNQWPKGLVMKDVREIEVWPGTPPGSYQITVSVYDPASGQWLPPAGGGDLIIGPVELPRREPPPVEALDIEHPLSANLGGKVRLLGYNMTGAFQPGNEVHLTLFWQALKAMDEDYTVFVHLADPQGHLWGQKDNPPVDGFYPTTAWEAREIVRDQYDLGISPDTSPGPYQIEVGMYLEETGERLPTLAKDGSVRGDKILLTRVEVAY